MSASCAQVDGGQFLRCVGYMTLEAVRVRCILGEVHVYRLDKYRSYPKIAPHMESQGAVENKCIYVVCA